MNTAKEFQKVVKLGQETDKPNVMTFVFSTPTQDLNNDIVEPDGIDYKNYIRDNPIILLHHDLHDWAIGKTIDLQVVGQKLIGTVEFFTDVEGDVGENARTAVALINKGVMGVSITFIPKTFDLLPDGNGVHVTKCRLIETSVVTVPSNLDSYKISASIGELPVKPLPIKSNKKRLVIESEMRKRKIAISRFST